MVCATQNTSVRAYRSVACLASCCTPSCLLRALIHTAMIYSEMTMSQTLVYRTCHGYPSPLLCVPHTCLLLTGVLILETKQSSLFSLVHRCRRFFPAGMFLSLF